MFNMLSNNVDNNKNIKKKYIYAINNNNNNNMNNGNSGGTLARASAGDMAVVRLEHQHDCEQQ